MIRGWFCSAFGEVKKWRVNKIFCSLLRSLSLVRLRILWQIGSQHKYCYHLLDTAGWYPPGGTSSSVGGSSTNSNTNGIKRKQYPPPLSLITTSLIIGIRCAYIINAVVLTKFNNNAKFFNLSNNFINHYHHSTYYSNLSVKFASYIDQYMQISSLVKLCYGI